jgi:hypothetical protein
LLILLHDQSKYYWLRKRGSTSSIYIGSKNRVQNRTRESLKKESLLQLLDNSQICTDIQQLKEADLYIMAVSDDAIASLQNN